MVHPCVDGRVVAPEVLVGIDLQGRSLPFEIFTCLQVPVERCVLMK